MDMVAQDLTADDYRNADNEGADNQADDQTSLSTPPVPPQKTGVRIAAGCESLPVI